MLHGMVKRNVYIIFLMLDAALYAIPRFGRRCNINVKLRLKKIQTVKKKLEQFLNLFFFSYFFFKIV